jgi:GR25 family glycosyltransferase involved in LPS biosynthesis
MTVNTFFDKVYCLNLDRRNDRWQNSQELFAKHNLQVEGFPATDWQDIFSGTAYEQRYRTNVAHLTGFVRFFKKVIAEGTGNVLLLEDDIEVPENFTELFNEYIEQVPGDWGMLYLGGNHSEGIVVATEGANVFRCHNTLATHAIGYRKEAFEYILYNLEYHLTRIMEMQPPQMYTRVVGSDVWLALLQQAVPTYTFNPALVWQRADYSDIEMTFTDSRHLLQYKL